MMRREFEAWLRAHPKRYSYSVITGYPAECGWVEKNLNVDLDQEYAKDRLESVFDRLGFDEGRNPLCARIDGNPYTNLATYRRAANSYKNFLDGRREGGSRTAIDDEVVPLIRRVVPEATSAGLEREDSVAETNCALPAAVETEAVRADPGDPIRNCTVSELLALHAAALDELRERNIVRSANGPGGDYAELLFSRAFGWKRLENSTAGYDAVDWSGRRYQIKSRRLSQETGSRQLSALRRLPEQNFDYLAAVLFEKDYHVNRAAMIPYATVVPMARFRQHTNSWTFLLDDRVWTLPNVQDVTQELRRTATELDSPPTGPV